MVQVPIEGLLKQCPSIYKLVVMAAKRAKELAEGAPKLVETEAKKVTTIALEEIREGKISYQATEDEKGDGKARTKKRGEKAAAGSKKKSS